MSEFNPFGTGNFGNTQRTFKGFSGIPKKALAASKVIAVAILALVLFFSSVYILKTGNESVITLFGQYVRTENTPGLKFMLPFIEKRYNVDVATVQRMEFGYRSTGNGQTTDAPNESRMLTSDENLVIADWTIQYRISNSYDYLFDVDDPAGTFRIIAESAYRRVVANHILDDILTNQKDAIQIEILADLQTICNKYGLGITVTGVQLQDAMPPDEVKDAFLDVTSAKEDKSSKVNEARTYANEKLPVARGDAQKLINDAEGYRQSRINEATGMVSRFNAIAAEYNKMPDITRTRLYLEMIKEVLPKVDKVYFVDEKGNTLQFLPLNSDSVTTVKSAATGSSK